MAILSISSSSSSSSSSSQSSEGHCHRREARGMPKFEHLHLHHTPSHPHCRGKKHHRHRLHSRPSPPPPSDSRQHFFGLFDHSPMEHHQLIFPMDCPHRHCHKLEDKLRVRKPLKHCKKVRKLHHKLMKAYKLPKSAHRGAAHHHHHMHSLIPSAKKEFPSTHFGHHHPPGCGCLHSMEGKRFNVEEPCCPREMSICHHHHRHRPKGHPHPPHCPMRSSMRCEVERDEIAPGSPKQVEALAEPPNIAAGSTAPLASDVPSVEEPAPVTLAA